MSFDSLGLCPAILKAIADQGYTEATPIQAQAIPVVLEGRDIMAGAQTGTGKTAAFTLPLLQRLSMHANSSPSPARHPVRALILTPTRELAVQVEESVKTYGKYLPLRSTVVYGGTDIRAQIKPLMEGVEILVATPGRLLDHIEQKTVKLSQVEILVLDEADRMLDMGFMPDLRRILALLPSTRQNLLFSATFAGEIKKLADSLLQSPVLIEVARRNKTAETVTQVAYKINTDDKLNFLVRLIRTKDIKQLLVFTKTKISASRVSNQLIKRGINAAAIHGDKTQGERIKALEDFKQGNVAVLVGTDVAARGLDIQELPVVINYELPTTPEDYIHRIGRTGRAGASGEAISLVAPEELRMLAEIERLIKHTIEVVDAGLVQSAEPPVARAVREVASSKPAELPATRTAQEAIPETPRALLNINSGANDTRQQQAKKQVAALFLPPSSQG
jgi:ATP-dependent RNA helicase RhlE